MLIIDSIYINRSGGKVLLEYLIRHILENKQQDKFYFLFDKRIVISENLEKNLIRYKYLTPTEKSRKEFYCRNIELFKTIFCFANVPPPIKIKDKNVVIYFQNVLLVNYFKSNISLNIIIKLFVKYIYIKLVNQNNYIWISQTLNVKNLIVNRLYVKSEMVRVIPFFDEKKFYKCNVLSEKNYKNYLYVADSSKQKNHLILIYAWELFTQKNENRDLTLYLTLPKSSSKYLLDKIDFLNKTGRNIVNYNECTVEQIKTLYKNCNYLIYPSLAESFGLPLIEAASAGCKIIASDLPYVYDVIEPSLVFNPKDVDSLICVLNASKDYHNVKKTKLIIENQIDKLLYTIKNV
jgi:glycosyltransferase involved in cell wall biosynthesis